jgi:DMSO/TMAO reductase YedYZ molybdopterin-dependent catalytic subunit
LNRKICAHALAAAAFLSLVVVAPDVSVVALAAQTSQGAPAASVAELKVGGAVATPLVLSLDDLKKMPRTTVSVVNPHDKKTEVYEGVLLTEILKRAGVPQGEQLRGAAMNTSVVAEASDNYRAVFSLAELDSGIGDAGVLVADSMDGAAMGGELGPLRLVAPKDKRPARWVRMLKGITVVKAGN